MNDPIKPGGRLKSVACETEVMVVKAPAEALDLYCGGHPMVAMSGQLEQQSCQDGYRQGTLMGKRYVDSEQRLEVLCTRAGEGSLSLGQVMLREREARLLPSSD